MNFSRSGGSSSEGGMFDSLKSRLGFSDSQADSGRGQHSRSRRYDDVDTGEFGYSDDDYDLSNYGGDYNEEDLAAYGPDYDDGSSAGGYGAVNPVSTRSAPRTSSYGSSRSKDFPNLVSIDDVRAHTTVPDRLQRDPLPARTSSSRMTSSSLPSNRVMVDDKLPDPTTPLPASASDAAPVRAGQAGSYAGSGTYAGSASGATSASQPAASARAGQQPARAAGQSSTFTPSAYDPYEAYANPSAAAHRPARSVVVVKPQKYGDVQQIAKTVKAGDVVVLSLRTTPDDLSKRILDFSFGVASALDASVEAPAAKVFAIATGAALTDAEKQKLSNEGVF